MIQSEYLLSHTMTRVQIFTRGIQWNENSASRVHKDQAVWTIKSILVQSSHRCEDSSGQVLDEGVYFLRINVASSDPLKLSFSSLLCFLE